MSVAKIIEFSEELPMSFEGAIAGDIAKASKTIHGIKSAWVKEQQVVIENRKVTYILYGTQTDVYVGWINGRML